MCHWFKHVQCMYVLPGDAMDFMRVFDVIWSLFDTPDMSITGHKRTEMFTSLD